MLALAISPGVNSRVESISGIISLFYGVYFIQHGPFRQHQHFICCSNGREKRVAILYTKIIVYDVNVSVSEGGENPRISLSLSLTPLFLSQFGQTQKTVQFVVSDVSSSGWVDKTVLRFEWTDISRLRRWAPELCLRNSCCSVFDEHKSISMERGRWSTQMISNLQRDLFFRPRFTHALASQTGVLVLSMNFKQLYASRCGARLAENMTFESTKLWVLWCPRWMVTRVIIPNAVQRNESHLFQMSYKLYRIESHLFCELSWKRYALPTAAMKPFRRGDMYGLAPVRLFNWKMTL